MFAANYRRVLMTMFACCVASTAFAQGVTPVAQGSFAPPPFYGYGAWGWGGGGDCYGPGTTPFGSYLAGYGQAVPAEGQYNLLTSEAMVNITQADKLDMENQLEWTKTYFEMRKLNEAYRNAAAGPTMTPETANRLARDYAPPRLRTSALDEETGEINWPMALETMEFRQNRAVLDQLFADRATTGQTSMAASGKIRANLDHMMAKLKTHIREMDTTHYMDARNFLTGMAREISGDTNMRVAGANRVGAKLASYNSR